MTPSAKRQAIALLVSEHRVSVVRACQVVRLARAAWYRLPPGPLVRDAAVVEALTDVVAAHGRWGFWKCYDRLRLLGKAWNHNACTGSTAPCGSTGPAAPAGGCPGGPACR